MRVKKRMGVATGGALFAAGLWIGCGAEAPVQPSGRSMGAPAHVEPKAAAEPPRVDYVLLEPTSPRPGSEVQARAETAAAPGSAIELRYLWAIDGRRVPERAGHLLVPESARKGATIEVEVVANDGRRSSDPVTATVRVGNRPPALLGVRLEPADVVRVGEEIVAVAEGRDGDGDPIDFTYAWTVNGELHETARERFLADDLKRGDEVVVRVRATDGEDETPPLDSAPVRVGNSAPAIVSTPVGVNSEGVFRYVVDARDPDGDRNLRFRLLAGPEGATIDPLLGEVVWTASADRVGTHSFEVEVEDGHGGRTQQHFEVTVRELQRNPTAAVLGDSGAEGDPASIE
jgi:hypothetical protein